MLLCYLLINLYTTILFLIFKNAKALIKLLGHLRLFDLKYVHYKKLYIYLKQV